MKYLFAAALLCTTLFVNAQDKFGDVFAKINADVQQNSKAYQTLKYETETIGHRLTGSTNGAKAEQYAFDLLKSYGCEVKFQPFEVESWARKTISVEIGADKNSLTKMKAVTLAHSPVSADVTGEIVDAGNGL